MNPQLFEAIENDDAPRTRSLLERGASSDAIKENSEFKDTALILACKNGNSEIVDALIAYHADVNRRAADGPGAYTPLIIAAATGRLDIVERLINAGADVRRRRSSFDVRQPPSSALFEAAARGHTDIVQLLILAGASIERQDLAYAIRGGYVPVVRLLLAAGADPRWIFRNQRTALQEAETSPPTTRSEMIALIKEYLVPPPPLPPFVDSSP